MKLLIEHNDGIGTIREFNDIYFSEGGKDGKIDMVAIALWSNAFEKGALDWFYHYDVQNENELKMVKEHCKKIINQLMELDYIKTSDFPIKGIDGDFYDCWGIK